MSSTPETDRWRPLSDKSSSRRLAGDGPGRTTPASSRRSRDARRREDEKQSCPKSGFLTLEIGLRSCTGAQIGSDPDDRCLCRQRDSAAWGERLMSRPGRTLDPPASTWRKQAHDVPHAAPIGGQASDSGYGRCKIRVPVTNPVCLCEQVPRDGAPALHRVISVTAVPSAHGSVRRSVYSASRGMSDGAYVAAGARGIHG